MIWNALNKTLTFLLVLVFKTYKYVISPWLPRACRFYPSCSVYAVEAVKKYGPIKGTGLAVWRILRCNPFCDGGYDPVP